MTSRERFNAVLNFQEVDRVPNIEIGYWDGLLDTWQEEGLPADIPFRPPLGDKQYSRNSKELTEYFGLDAHDIAYSVKIGINPTTPYTYKVIAEDEKTKTVRRSDGCVRKHLKSNEGIFHDMDWPVKCREDWARVKETIRPGWRNMPSPDDLPSNDRDYPAIAGASGFFWQMREWMGFEQTCMVFHLDPAFAREMLAFWSDYLVANFSLMLTRFTPDFVILNEDMCYKNGPMISPEIVEEFLVPHYCKVVECFVAHGVDVIGIDSDGLPDELIPVLHKAGVNLWSPFEIICRKGHPGLVELAEQYPWLIMLGGIDKTRLSLNNAAMDEELAKIRPLTKRGGYIPMVDHKVPPEVSFDAYKYYLAAKSKLLSMQG